MKHLHFIGTLLFSGSFFKPIVSAVVACLFLPSIAYSDVFYINTASYNYVAYESKTALRAACDQLISEAPPAVLDYDQDPYCFIPTGLPLSVNRCGIENSESRPGHPGAPCHCSNEGFSRFIVFGKSINEYRDDEENLYIIGHRGVVCIAGSQCPDGYKLDPATNYCEKEPECECNEQLLSSTNECAEMDISTSVDWDKSLLYMYPDNNHDHAPRCEGIPLREKNSCETSSSSNTSTEVGNPIDCATGRKVQSDTDYQGFGMDPLSYSREYQSPMSDTGASESETSLWKNHSQPRFNVTTYEDGSELATITVGDWLRRVFYRPGGLEEWQTNPSLDRVEFGDRTEGGFSISANSGEVYHFAANGDPVVTERNGEQRYFYSMTQIEGESRLSQVRNRFGDTLDHEYDSEGRLTRLVDQDGLAVHYRYDSLGNLTEVIYPDNTPEYLDDNPRKTYLYGRPELPHHLTGVLDQNGDRYATFAYDEDGRAIRTEHADGAERVEVSYPAEGEAIVRFYQDASTDLYREEHYTYGHFRGSYRLISKTIIQCQGCTMGAETWDYNDAGLLVRHTNLGGQVTEWTYDDQGRKLTETVAVGTSEARTTRYRWHDDWNKLQTVETDTEITAYVYDDQGHRIETTVTPKD